MQAVGIPQISDEITEVDVTALANLFGLGSDDVRRQAGPIDVLIGINYSRFLVGETKVKGSSSRKEEPTWLGDIWFQRRRFNAANQTTVYCSPCPTVDMTDFWKTESMGVSIAPCRVKVPNCLHRKEKSLS